MRKDEVETPLAALHGVLGVGSWGVIQNKKCLPKSGLGMAISANEPGTAKANGHSDKCSLTHSRRKAFI